MDDGKKDRKNHRIILMLQLLFWGTIFVAVSVPRVAQIVVPHSRICGPETRYFCWSAETGNLSIVADTQPAGK